MSYLRPASLAEALRQKSDHPDHLVIAGGTDIMVGAGERPPPPALLDLFGLPELVGIDTTGAASPQSRPQRLRIGAATPYAVILRDQRVRDHLGALHRCISEIGAAQIQARGTMGGNIATSSPVGDTLPVLLAYGAVIEVASTRGSREIPYELFCTGYRKTALAADELIVAIHIPIPSAGTFQFWRKVGTRSAQAISKVMVAALGEVEGGAIRRPRLAMGAVSDRPVRLTEAEAFLEGQRPNEATADELAQRIGAALRPIDDVRSSRAYRLRVAQNLSRRFVLSLPQGAAS